MKALMPIWLLALARPLAAQELPTYDLAAVVRTALARHPRLQAARAQVEGAEARLAQARAGAGPRLGLELGYLQLADRPSFSVAGMGTMVFGEKENQQVSLRLEYPLFTGGLLSGLKEQSRAQLEGARSAQSRLRQKLMLDAALAYFSVLRARELVKVAEDQQKALEAQRDAIAAMLEAGVTTRIDLLRAETAVAAAQEGLARSVNSEGLARAALAHAIGLPADHSVQVVDLAESPAPPDDPVRQLLAQPLPTSLAEAVEEALRRRAELTELQAVQRAARMGERVARSQRRPQLGAFAHYDAERFTVMPDTGDWSLGVRLIANLLDGGAASAGAKQARAGVLQAQAALDELRSGIVLEVTQAFLDLQSARDRLRTAAKAVASAEEGQRLVELGYRNGVNTITDLLAAQAELTGARTDQVVARYDLHDAEARLRCALGRDVETP